ncbi:uncharacterized protein CLUP02_04422 [Colletotrichum lupini]|uniref:Uncharacterized protein n=1 Tax=Colletotrichum lupini TaxID=145971 RepID=A0A9Q8SKM2_9PEZI|nr:uncharacterized protein CLUP02_04422 [Colletotrichum lupini]UQC78943.1 hypothetical protein CLUP02_04422 [Colletotrichum lupini]
MLSGKKGSKGPKTGLSQAIRRLAPVLHSGSSDNAQSTTVVTVYAQSNNVIQRIRRRRSKKFPATFQDKRSGNFHTVLRFVLGASDYFPILQPHIDLYGAEFGLVLQTHDTQLSRYNSRVPHLCPAKVSWTPPVAMDSSVGLPEPRPRPSSVFPPSATETGFERPIGSVSRAKLQSPIGGILSGSSWSLDPLLRCCVTRGLGPLAGSENGPLSAWATCQPEEEVCNMVPRNTLREHLYLVRRYQWDKWDEKNEGEGWFDLHSGPGFVLVAFPSERGSRRPSPKRRTLSNLFLYLLTCNIMQGTQSVLKQKLQQLGPYASLGALVQEVPRTTPCYSLHFAGIKKMLLPAVLITFQLKRCHDTGFPIVKVLGKRNISKNFMLHLLFNSIIKEAVMFVVVFVGGRRMKVQSALKLQLIEEPMQFQKQLMEYSSVSEAFNIMPVFLSLYFIN